jgi:DNA-binding transcriptional LysR family regulator
MKVDLGDLNAFVAVARARGFRDGARASGASASGLSEAVRRLEAQLGIRLLNRTTRSVAPTEAGLRLLEQLGPALTEVEAALDIVNGFREKPAGTLRLNVPVSAARLVLPAIVPRFLAAYPEIRLEVIAEDTFVDLLAAGCDAGIRYEERLEQDMIAVPIGPRFQRFATAASPSYLDRRGRPTHPRDLLGHACLRGRFTNRTIIPWEFERDGEVVRVDPPSSSRTGCARISTAARSNPCSNPGGSGSRGRSSTTPDAASCPHRCGHSSISSRHPVRRSAASNARKRDR